MVFYMSAAELIGFYHASPARNVAGARTIDFYYYGREFKLYYSYASGDSRIYFECKYSATLNILQEKIKDDLTNIEVYYKIDKQGPDPDNWFLQIDKLVLREHPRKCKHVLIKGDQ